MDEVKEVEITDEELIDYLEALELERQQAEHDIAERIALEWMEDEV